jgi:dihydrolipoamide dehydrogenase
MKYQVIIIGGGPAGYTAAEAAGKGGLSVLLIEKNSLGGVCLNEGVFTKTLCIRQDLWTVQNHASSMQSISGSLFDLPKIIARKSKVERKQVLGVKAKLDANNVTIVSGEAQIIDKIRFGCGGRDLRRRELY